MIAPLTAEFLVNGLPGAAARHAMGSVLVVDDEERIRKLVSASLQRAGYEVATAADGVEALERVAQAVPDLILSDVVMPGVDGLELLRRLRAELATRAIPVILLTGKASVEDVVAGLEMGADDYLAKPFRTAELLARVRARMERPPVPKDALPQDRQTGLLSERRFFAELERELARTTRVGRTGCLAYLDLHELPRLRAQLGGRAEAALARQVAALIHADSGRLELAGRDAQGRFLLLLPVTNPDAAQERLDRLSRRVADHAFTAGAERVRLTLTIGFATAAAGTSGEQLRDQALLALAASASQLDIHPTRFTPAMKAQAATKHPGSSPCAKLRAALRLPVQIAITGVIGLLLPFLFYVAVGAMGWDITPTLYMALVLAMLGTALLIAMEGRLALRRVDPPEEPGSPYPPASAIIAAYLPNEAPVIIETIEAFLRVEYPGPLQVILAYNTPRDLPVEAALQELARRDPRFVPLRVEGSTSKAQNINAALAEVTGEFVGVFDADHQPDPDSFTRAWRWLSNGYDVVQGHCPVRNADASCVARLAEVEFESFYRVSHPGREQQWIETPRPQDCQTQPNSIAVFELREELWLTQ